MDTVIVDFLQENKLATVCCLDDEGHPYCFNCYVAYDPVKQRLYFKSHASTFHAQMLLKHKAVAGTLLPAKVSPLDTRGIQFTGEVVGQPGAAGLHAAKLYYKRYPVALAIPGDIWTIALNNVKLTENTNGIKKKNTWSRAVEPTAG